MTDETTEDTKDAELIPVETPPEQDDDERLANDAEDASHDDDGDDDGDNDGKPPAKDNRSRRRREAKARDKEELARLRDTVGMLVNTVQELRGGAAEQGKSQIQERLAQAESDVVAAESIYARAVSDGDGETAAKALRIMNAAQADAAALRGSVEKTNQPAKPQLDPNIVNYSRKWAQDNADWFDPTYGNAESVAARKIDAELTRDGWNPASPGYWQELQRRCDAELFEPAPKPKSRRQPPPTGRTTEHVPPSTRNEVYVNPERKQAMIESGAWDDPVRRQRALKQYAEWDRENRA